MTYFYATGDDKTGNTLITSYKQEAQATKYRPGAQIVEGLRYLDLSTGVLGKVGDVLVRTIISRKSAQEELRGDFVVYAKANGAWFETQFRYETYAAANAAVKGALIMMYDACAVIEDV
jgi:hypothetical protein